MLTAYYSSALIYIDAYELFNLVKKRTFAKVPISSRTRRRNSLHAHIDRARDLAQRVTRHQWLRLALDEIGAFARTRFLQVIKFMYNYVYIILSLNCTVFRGAIQFLTSR
jgi:hypothetical protein